MSHLDTISEKIEFYSIEYIDTDGETNIVHEFMKPSDALKLLEKFKDAGITARIYQISPINPKM